VQAGVPEDNIAQRAFMYQPARISLYAFDEHETGDVQSLEATLHAYDTFVLYASGYVANYLDMLIMEFEGKRHVILKTPDLSSAMLERYATDFVKAVELIRAALPPVALRPALEQTTKQAATEITDELVALKAVVRGGVPGAAAAAAAGTLGGKKRREK
jgi:hypothetical protein